MVSDNRETKPANISKRKGPAGRVPAYDARTRFYGILLLFIVVVGLPIVSLPSLRNRLIARVTAIQEAILGKSEPVTAEVGETTLPFPKEYERPDSEFFDPGDRFPNNRIFTALSADLATKVDTPPALITPESAKIDAASSSILPEDISGKSASRVSDSDDGVHYTQGDVEQEMYALLLKAYPKVSEMVEGREPALQFRSWGSAKVSADIYWVRLIFQAGNDKEIEYIWQVEVPTKQVLPLSHNARTIS